MSVPNGSGLSFAPIDISAVGDNIIIPASSRSIFVNRIVLALATASSVQFKSGARLLSGPQIVPSLVWDYSEQPWYVCDPDEAFIISLGTSVQTGGTVWFQYGP